MSSRLQRSKSLQGMMFLKLLFSFLFSNVDVFLYSCLKIICSFVMFLFSKSICNASYD